MAIIYSYPPAQSLSGNDLLVVSKKEDEFSTKSVTLSKLVEFINGQPSGGVGTTNAIVKFTDGPGGLIGDSIMNEDVDKINLNGILRIADNNNNRLEVKYGTDSSTTHLNNAPANNHIIGRAGDLIIKNRARSKDILFQGDDGQNNGNVATYFRLDGSMADVGTPDYYTRWGSNSHIVLGDSANVNNLDFEMYHDGSDTMVINGESFLTVESSGGILIENKSSSNLEIINSAAFGEINIESADDIKLKGTGSAEYFRIDSGLNRNVAYKNIQYRDNVKALFGTSNDLEIYHDGSDSYIDDVGTGDLIIKAVDDVFIKGSNHDMGRFNEQGVVLYHIGTSKFETNSTGVKIPQAGDGLQLVSPNGTVYTLTVDNAGNLVVT